ncbi:MAG: prephenate dehydrogenase [Clostridia bacterium]|nr:prephenate dehydrogenase [Clostridia bacterium]
MTVGVVGLGLIGGSFARAYSGEGHTVLAYDTDKTILDFAILSGAVSAPLTDDRLCECDLVLVCTYPQAACSFLEEKGSLFGKKPVVIDCCGTKLSVVKAGMASAEKHGFTYAGGHPMAGTQFSGFGHSRMDLFCGAVMVIIPPRTDDIRLLDKIKALLAPAGFGSITVTTAEVHDRVIAFSSQLAHVVSNAYVKSPTAREHTGMSAGSYRDLTRVAKLNPEMWTQLFMENSENLTDEIDCIIKSLTEYRDAIAAGDRERLKSLLADGSRIKEEVDGK